MCGQWNAEESVREARREIVIRYASLYEGLNLSSFSHCGYSMGTEARFWGTDIPVIRNVIHEVIDTFVSKIGALDTPKTAMLTTEGSWRDRRQAKDVERLLEGEQASRKGDFATENELWIQALRIAAAAPGAVIVRYYADCGKVGAKIHDTLDCAISNDGTWVIISTWYEVDDAVELFPTHEVAIRASAGRAPDEVRPPTESGMHAPEMVEIVTGWRGRRGDKPGCYCAALAKECHPLEWEEYAHEFPPTVKLVIDPHLKGPWGHSLTHHAYESCYRDNVIYASIDRSISKTNKSRTYADKSRLAEGSSLETTEDADVIYVEGDYVPHTESPPGFNKDQLQVAQQHYQDAHNIVGVSEMHTAGRREPGVDSAVGQRFVAALVNERFAAVQRRYVHAVAVEAARCKLQVLCDIYRDDKKLTRLWPGQDTLREISASSALKGVESLKYVFQAAAVSGSRNSPADRAQSASELFNMGILSPDRYASLQQGGYDLPEELDQIDTQREWWDKQIERWQFASDKEVAQPDFYVPPLRHMNVQRGLLRLIDGFLEAQMAGLEDERLEFFLMAMGDLDAIAAQSPELSTAPQLPAPSAPVAGPPALPAPMPNG